jgi:hypothetical protein
MEQESMAMSSGRRGYGSGSAHKRCDRLIERELREEEDKLEQRQREIQRKAKRIDLEEKQRIRDENIMRMVRERGSANNYDSSPEKQALPMSNRGTQSADPINLIQREQ